MIIAGSLSRKTLRQQLRQARRNLSACQQKSASRALYRQLAQHPLFRRARHIALYISNDAEINPAPLLQAAWQRGKAIYLPLLPVRPAKRMLFQRVRRGETLYPNRFGIAEPRFILSHQRPPWALDLMLLPLVGFDPHGGRLGMGGGFYDRSLAYLHRRQHWKLPALIGLAHDCQKVDRLPLEVWDVPLTATLTDRRWYPAPARLKALGNGTTKCAVRRLGF